MTETSPAIEGRVIEYQGRRYPRVTTILQECGLIDYSRVPEAKLELAAWRGSAVHQACLYDDQGDLNEQTMTPELMPYLEAWRAAKRDMRFCVAEAEVRRFWHGPPQFCGQADRIGAIDGEHAIIDLKTCAIQSWVRWQLVAYAQPFSRSGLSPRRIAVQLKPDGRYAVTEFFRSEYQRDLAVFNAALQIWWAKEGM